MLMKSILDANFRYTPSDQTDIRKTFARIRREIKRGPKQTVDVTVQESPRTVNNVTSMWPSARRAVS